MKISSVLLNEMCKTKEFSLKFVLCLVSFF